MALPLVGSVDWKWFLIGILFGHHAVYYLFSGWGRIPRGSWSKINSLRRWTSGNDCYRNTLFFPL